MPYTQIDGAQAALLCAWETTAEPDVVDAGDLPWAAPPTTELRLSGERPATNDGLPTLDTLADLAPIVAGDGSRPMMAVTITRAPRIPSSERRDLARRALVHMARKFGYIDADLNALA